jgi:hypothetical protein
MRKLIGILGLVITVLLSACGGGGGSPGTTVNQPYSVTLQADKTRLPVNVGHYSVGQGVNAPFTTTLYVNATVGGRPIPPGDKIFGCNIASGLASGALYYLDGNPEHMTDDTPPQPAAYRSIDLPSNSGGSSFHLHALDQAGVVRIICSAQNPADGIVYSASVDIAVGGGVGTGRPASLHQNAQSFFLGTQQNVNDIRNSVGITAAVLDDAVQPVPDPVAANVQVRIVTGMSAAEVGARLLSGSQSGNQVQLRTINGVAQFSLSSGPARGVILLELAADRFDNNVSNGIQDPIIQWAVIPVIAAYAVPPSPVVDTGQTCDMEVDKESGCGLAASGGIPPYTWTKVGGVLPPGVSFSSDGLISGTPTAEGSYVIQVFVTDVEGFSSAAENVTITVAASTVEPTPPAPAPLSITTSSITGKVGASISEILVATGGTPSYTWALIGTLPPGLTLNPAGVILGTIGGAPSTYTVAIQVTDSADPQQTVVKNITFTVTP